MTTKLPPGMPTARESLLDCPFMGEEDVIKQRDAQWSRHVAELEQRAAITLGAVVLAAGGEVRVPGYDLGQLNNKALTRDRDAETLDCIFRVRSTLETP